MVGILSTVLPMDVDALTQGNMCMLLLIPMLSFSHFIRRVNLGINCLVWKI